MDIAGHLEERRAASIGSHLVDGVREIDFRCNGMIGPVERGLCNIHGQFAEVAFQELRKRLTEETITSWLLSKTLKKAGFKVELERHYPDSREECDLVIDFGGERLFWIEVKYAWWHWFNCDGTSGHSSVRKGYLHGDKSHPGAAHDFIKLSRFGISEAAGTGVLLIGLDSLHQKMDADVSKLQQQRGFAAQGWTLAAHRAWADRRNNEFRINCWFWCRDLVARPHTPTPPEAR